LIALLVMTIHVEIGRDDQHTLLSRSPLTPEQWHQKNPRFGRIRIQRPPEAGTRMKRENSAI
jgi:hypothetical protein